MGPIDPTATALKCLNCTQKPYPKKGEDCQILDLLKVDASWIQESHFGDNVPEFEQVVKRFIHSVQKLVFIVPEYNGGFPGYLKYFIDACNHGDWKDKKVALIGLATGRGGNLRGVDHLTGILHYLGSEVYSKKVYLSQVNQLMTADGQFVGTIVSDEIDAQIAGFVTF